MEVPATPPPSPPADAPPPPEPAGPLSQVQTALDKELNRLRGESMPPKTEVRLPGNVDLEKHKAWLSHKHSFSIPLDEDAMLANAPTWDLQNLDEWFTKFEFKKYKRRDGGDAALMPRPEQCRHPFTNEVVRALPLTTAMRLQRDLLSMELIWDTLEGDEEFQRHTGRYEGAHSAWIEKNTRLSDRVEERSFVATLQMILEKAAEGLDAARTLPPSLGTALLSDLIRANGISSKTPSLQVVHQLYESSVDRNVKLAALVKDRLEEMDGEVARLTKELTELVPTYAYFRLDRDYGMEAERRMRERLDKLKDLKGTTELLKVYTAPELLHLYFDPSAPAWLREIPTELTNIFLFPDEKGAIVY